MNSSLISNSRYNIHVVNKMIVIFLFILYPVVALPFICSEIIRGRRYAFTLLALFIAWLGFLYPPTGDLYRYHLDFEYYKVLDYPHLLETLKGGMDILQPISFWALSKIGFNANATRFLYVYIATELIFSICYDFIKKYSFSKKQIVILLLLVILYIRFERLTVRFGLSTSLFIFGWYSCLYKNKNRFMPVILSILNHFAFIVPLIAFLGSLVCKYRFRRWLILALILVSFTLSGDYLSALINMLPFDDSVINHLLVYTDGYWAGAFYEDHSAKFKLGNMLMRLPFFVLSFVFYKWYSQDKLSISILFMLIVVVVSSPFESLRMRMEQVYVWQLIVFCMVHSKQWIFNKRFVHRALAIGMIYLFLSTWTIRRQLSISHESKILYPSWVIYHSGYDNNWVNVNVYEDGAPANISF